MKTSKTCFVKCAEGHRAFKVSGEKHTFFCSDCELKFTSDKKPYYTYQFDKSKSGPGKKDKRKKGSVVKPKAAALSPRKAIKDLQLKTATSCFICIHRNVCYLLRDDSSLDLSRIVCNSFFVVPEEGKKDA